MRSGLLRTALAFLFLNLAASVAAQTATDAERGRLLYETRCGACHVSSVHNRDARKAKSFNDLRAQVLRWSAESSRSWTADEIDDVTLYLNQRYYGLPCPQSACRGNQASLAR